MAPAILASSHADAYSWKIGILPGSAFAGAAFFQTPASTRAMMFLSSTAAVRSFQPPPQPHVHPPPLVQGDALPSPLVHEPQVEGPGSVGQRPDRDGAGVFAAHGRSSGSSVRLFSSLERKERNPMRLRQAVRLAPAAGSSPASGAELALTLPSFDDL